ncbi:MAG: sensor histidine kinase [Janthinobacterium lividum]
MNSLTPVTSLAATALRLVGTLDDGAPGIADAQLAIGALARRAAELERFVDSYKGFSETPVLRQATIPIGPWFDELARLFAASPAGAGVEVVWAVAPGSLPIDGDIALLTQVMINLLKNAGEATAGTRPARISITAGPTTEGRIRIAIEDNGPGIPAALRQDVFLPFFTTKPTGTGIGLSLARQIVLLHGGQIGLGEGDGGCIELILPAAHAGVVSGKDSLFTDGDHRL